MKKLIILIILILHANFLQASHDGINAFNIKINNFEYTKLGIACTKNNAEAVNKLISLGANIDLAKKDEYYIYDALYVAIESNSLNVLALLLKNNININQVYTETGITPVALAVILNNYHIVDILLQHKADPNGPLLDTTDNSVIPLLLAFENDNIEIAKLLLKYNANTNVKNELGENLDELFKNKGAAWYALLKDSNR